MASIDSTQPITSASDEPIITFKKRGAKAKTNLRKRPATPPPASDSSSYTSSEDESGHKIKRRRTKGILVASSDLQKPNTSSALDGPTKFAADRTSTIEKSNDATKQSNWYDENAPDALSAAQLLGNSKKRPAAAPVGESDGTYRGLANSTKFIETNPDRPSKAMGPIKAPTNIRTITVTDFAPDVCKDYKQTGFCGFGDSCKFLHAREDYKQGWELDRDWEIGTKGKKLQGTTVASANRGAKGDAGDEDAEDALLESIPFACIICKKPYRSPVVTRCGHYYCEDCALKRYRKDPSCAACGAGTGGVFNVAKNLRKLLDKKRERAKKRREKAIEEGLEVSDEEEG